MAVKWAITEKFHDYLYGNKFTVITDNNPLTYVLSSAKLDATSQRWIAALSNFNFEILYRPGNQNADADGLSRIPPETIKAMSCMNQIPLIESLTVSSQVIDDNFQEFPNEPEINIRQKQCCDPVLRFWYYHVRNNYKPQKFQLPMTDMKDHLFFHRNFDRLKIQNGILVRETAVNNKNNIQIILPRACIRIALKLLHTEMGYPGRDKTNALVKDRFCWRGMLTDIEHYIKNCKQCILRKTTPERTSLVNIQTHEPLDLVCMDYLTLETSKGGFSSILVITDYFTRFALAIPKKNQTAKTTADILFKHFIIHYGIPKKNCTVTKDLNLNPK